MPCYLFKLGPLRVGFEQFFQGWFSNIYLGCTIRNVAGSALCARNVFSCFFLQFSRNPLFCILPRFSDTFLRLKRCKMFLSAGRTNAAAESNTRPETAMLCVCVG